MELKGLAKVKLWPGQSEVMASLNKVVAEWPFRENGAEKDWPK